MDHPTPRIFFIHIMKTGGHSLQWMLQSVYSPEQKYPDRRGLQPDELHRGGRFPEVLGALTEEDADRIRLYSGHLPFYATGLVRRPVTTVTVLRNPVDRTLSHLRQLRRDRPELRAKTLEEIYGDWAVQLTQINNHQTKVFSATPNDGAGTAFEIFEVDADRGTTAIENLSTVDIVGVSEDFDDFRRRLAACIGYDLPAGHAFKTPDQEPVDPTFRARIALDNAYDMALYEAARGIVDRQRQQLA